MNKSISVIIVSYKNLEILKDCLNSIYKHNDIGDKLEIIIVDNSPDNKVYDYVKEKWKEVIIIKNDNKGFGEANNVGVKIARSESILFLNPDTILVEPIFKFALEKFAEDEKLAMFGLKLIDENFKRNMSYYFMDQNNFIYGQLNKIFNKLDLYFDGKMFISGANIFISKKVFLTVGMFDENIFMYYEESDLTKRLKKINLKTSYFKQKKIIHLEGKMTNNNVDALKRRLDSLNYYCKKYNQNLDRYLKNEKNYYKIKIIIYKILQRDTKSLRKSFEMINVYKST